MRRMQPCGVMTRKPCSAFLRTWRSCGIWRAERMSTGKRIDTALLLLGLACHLIGMPLAEYVDARWFYLVLAGEGIWMVYAQVGWKRRKKE